MDEFNNLNVLFASSNEYCPFLGVTIYSLLKNNAKDFDKINIYIFDNGIENYNKIKLSNLISPFNTTISYIEIKNIEELLGEKLYSLNNDYGNSFATYARLFADSLLPKDLDKIIYLDSDSIVLGSFRELWDMDLEDYYAAGVTDLLNLNYVKNQVNLDYSKNYVNAGFLYINLKKWREDNIEEKFIKFLKDNVDKFIFYDQGIINGVLGNKMKYVHPKYNFLSYFHNRSYKNALKWAGCSNYYDESCIEEANKNPVFIHFCQTMVMQRPWDNNKHPFIKIYREYLNETPFKDEIKLDKSPGIFFNLYKNKFINCLFRFIPISFAVKINELRIKKFANKQMK